MPRILVVDDDFDHQKYVITVLERIGYTAAGATDGGEALASLADGGFDIVLTDIFMPGTDGIELVKSIKSQRLGVTVIGMTGGYRGVSKPYETVLGLMADGQVLRKPFSAGELEYAIKSATGT